MILSMTGFGRAKGNYKDASINVEIKSLNGKMFDLRSRIPVNLKSKEVELRNIVIEHAHRGKFDLTVTVEGGEGEGEYMLNRKAFAYYLKEIKELSAEHDLATGELFQTILRIPNVISTTTSEADQEEWDAIRSVIFDALEQLQQFRITEGKTLFDDLQHRVNTIQSLLVDVTPHEDARIETLKERFRKNLKDFFTSEQVDRNRFEQELVYYTEKLDINEEKVRLDQHCTYFLEILKSDTIEVGKKLGFIAQEMGREINTLGAKAQEKNIQRIVVSMKDELEKIKEQLANVV